MSDTKSQMQYFCDTGREVMGPLTSRDIRDMATRGFLKPTYQLRNGVDGTWVNADSVRGLFEPHATEFREKKAVRTALATNVTTERAETKRSYPIGLMIGLAGTVAIASLLALVDRHLIRQQLDTLESRLSEADGGNDIAGLQSLVNGLKDVAKTQHQVLAALQQSDSALGSELRRLRQENEKNIKSIAEIVVATASAHDELRISVDALESWADDIHEFLRVNVEVFGRLRGWRNGRLEGWHTRGNHDRKSNSPSAEK